MAKDSCRVLLVYPAFPRTYWGMQYSLPLFDKKALMPPLGLITIAALTPAEYECRLVDLNCAPLTAADLAWADMVCFSAMLPQKASLFETARRCRAAGKLVVFGGPFPTACREECAPHCNVQVLNEGEVTWPLFLDDYARGILRSVYTSEDKPDVAKTPAPRFDLLRIEDYAIIPIQYSRGCPFQCEFCDIIVMFGRRPRTKTPGQLCGELQALYDTGYRGMVFIVDDNFIGNIREVRRLLPELEAWNQARGRPFVYATEASVNLADHPALVRQMVGANFRWVFLGIESPSLQSLQETLKHQNTRRPLLASVEAIQKAGLCVFGGFIIGFDSDDEHIFDQQIEFITRAGIGNAMVGLLAALPGTPLHRRMQETGRLKPDAYESDQCGYTNIVTVLPERTLLEGYRKLIATIYTPRAYFARALDGFARLPHARGVGARVREALYLLRFTASAARRGRTTRSRTRGVEFLARLGGLLRFLTRIPAEYRWPAATFAWAVLRKAPDQFPGVLLFIFMGVHLCRFSAEDVLPQVERALGRLLAEGMATHEPSGVQMTGTWSG